MDASSSAFGNRHLPAAALRVLLSVFGAGVTWSIWLVAVLASRQGPPRPVSFALVMTAPPATALGFALGTRLGERLTRASASRFLQAFAWPLLGCIAGALVVYPFGPMLVVLGLFGLGTAAVAGRELLRLTERERGAERTP